ncbi:hypothetical protein [Candidatus Uabimicrobium amorphum]|nr:hypothetical protein [Candidatus Uabimicrobium amorphum]
MADLYMQGQITDQHDNRWEIWIVPGICPMLEYSKESWEDTAEILEVYTTKEFWEDCAEWNSDSLKFARDSFTKYLIEGIGEDYAQASSNISANVRETPFGWMPRIIGNALWGYLFVPTMRVATAPIGIAGGLVGSVVFPVGQTILPVPVAIGYATINGVLVPVSGIAAHQFIYLFAIPNREPSPEHDRRFGLYIINNDRKDAAPGEIIIESESEHNQPIKQKEEHEKPQVRKTLDKMYLQKLAAEYIALRQLTDIYLQKQKQLQSSHFSIHMNESSLSKVSHRFSHQTYLYYKSTFAKDFREMWREAYEDLPNRQSLALPVDKAFTDFCQNVVERIGFYRKD